jgi:regulator of protease activity HflC (stomatin/prohibitin superfamily)
MRIKILLLILLIISLSIGCVKIEPGKVGVLTNNMIKRGVDPKPLETGFRLVIPIVQQVDIYDIRVRKYEMTKVPTEGEKAGRDDIDFKTVDGQVVFCDVTLIYSLIKDLVPQLHQAVGKEYLDQALRPTARSTIRNYLGMYTADNIYSGEIRIKVQDAITNAMNKSLNGIGINVVSILIRTFEFSEAFESKIEEKALAAQEVEVNRNKVKAAEELAKKLEAESKGKRLAMVQEAEGIAQKKRLEADAWRYEQEQQAKGILAVALAEAEGKGKLAEALGSGDNVVKLEFARRIPDKLQIWGIPTGQESSSFMDLSGVFKNMFTLSSNSAGKVSEPPKSAPQK